MKILIVIIAVMSVASLFMFVSAFSACSNHLHIQSATIASSNEKQDNISVRIMSDKVLDEVSVGDLISKPEEAQLFIYTENTYR